jgi:DNA-binding CsgD family transcriptional regulator
MNLYTPAILSKVPALQVYTALEFVGHFPMTREEDDLRACLLGLQHLLLPGVSIIVALSGPGEAARSFSKILNVSWPEDWVIEYLNNGYASIDPVHRGPLDKPIIWSEAYNSLDQSNRSHRRFLGACALHDMTHGLSFIHDYGTHRVILSFAGIATETDRDIQIVLTMVQRHLCAAASRIMGPRDLLHTLSNIDRSLVTSLAEGLRDNEAAEKAGLSIRTARRKIKQLVDRYDANTRAGLIYKLMRPTLH